jgi:hypothetical protein
MLMINSLTPMDWEEKYRKGEVFWDKGAPSPPVKQYLERHAVRRRTLVPGYGYGHEVDSFWSSALFRYRQYLYQPNQSDEKTRENNLTLSTKARRPGTGFKRCRKVFFA